LVICCSIADCLQEHNWLYRTGDSLGSGSFGEVFVVDHKVDGSKYAVKMLKKTSEDVAETKVKEAELMCQLQHENICRYYNAWRASSGLVYIRMELCDIDLVTWLKRRNNLLFQNDDKSKPYDEILKDAWVLPERDWRNPSYVNVSNTTSSSQQTWFSGINARGTNEFLKGLLKGVDYLHVRHRLAHQDLHCKNVLLKFSAAQDAVTAKICDFGLSSRKTVSPSNDDLYHEDLENVGKIMIRMYYPLKGDGVSDLLSQLQKSSRSHTDELNADFSKMWPYQASWIRRLLIRDIEKPSAKEMLEEGDKNIKEFHSAK